MITYIIDNGLDYSSHCLYFVEAPVSFGNWLEKTLVPWCKARSLRGRDLKIVATCLGRLTWRIEDASMTLDSFLADDMIVEEFDYTETYPERRPRFQGV